MNKAKLTALCAQAMGYTIIDNLHVKDASGNWVVDGSDYNPLDDANQADALLEYVADGRGYGYMSHPVPHAFITPGEQFRMEGKNEKEAKVLCALRASDKVTDAEIAVLKKHWPEVGYER